MSKFLLTGGPSNRQAVKTHTGQSPRKLLAARPLDQTFPTLAADTKMLVLRACPWLSQSILSETQSNLGETTVQKEARLSANGKDIYSCFREHHLYTHTDMDTNTYTHTHTHTKQSYIKKR